MKISTMLVAAVASAVVFSSCTNLEKGTLVTVAGVDSIKLDPANDGKRFAVEGYMSTPSLMNVTSGEPTSVSIYTEPAGKGKSICSVDLKYGYGRNSFTVPTNYSDEDITLRDNEGKQLSYDAKAMFSFTAKRVAEQKYDSGEGKWKATGEYYWDFRDVRVDAVK